MFKRLYIGYERGVIMKKQNKKNGVMDIVFLLDRSGSMSGMESDTIGGYNSYLNSMRSKNVKVTTVLFDNEYEMITKRENIDTVKAMTDDIYYTRGSTALLDAIGSTIRYMDKETTNKVLFVITTDGEENSSKEYSKKQIKELILGHSNWEFIYIGANIDSYSEASSIGIRHDRTSNYNKSKKGMEKLFSSISKVSMCYEEDGCIASDWNKELDN